MNKAMPLNSHQQGHLKNICHALVAMPLLAACVSTVDETIPLPVQFASNAELITVKTPTWRIPDSVYNKTLGDYQVQNAKTSGTRSDSKLIDIKQDNSFINFLLFDTDFSSIVKEFEINGVQRYSFDLTRHNDLVAKAKCELYTLNIEKYRTHANEDDTNITPVTTSNHRLKTFLACEIEQQGQQWQLTLKSFDGIPLAVSLKSQALQPQYRAEEVAQSLSLVNEQGGVSERPIPSWLSGNAGVSFFDAEQQIAALSFVGNTKIWLNKSLAEQEKTLLMTASYSLSMFNWLDSDWRSSMVSQSSHSDDK